MADMTAATSVRHLPTMTGADGRPDVERFYREVVLPCLPGDLGFARRSRTVDRFHLVDELTVSFVHDCGMTWLIPGIEPTGRHASVAAIVVVDFDRGAIASQRTLWDGASLAAQLGVTVGPPQATLPRMTRAGFIALSDLPRRSSAATPVSFRSLKSPSRCSPENGRSGIG